MTEAAPDKRLRFVDDRGLVYWERALCFALAVAGIALHLRYWVCAGPLWRDEADFIVKSTASPLSEFVECLKIGPFPIFSLLIFRAWSAVEDSDIFLRLLGFLIGISSLGAVWWVSWRLTRRLGPLSAALFTFSAAAIVEGDAVRPYGLGALFALFAFLFIWEAVSRPSIGRAALAALAGVFGVQCLFPNAIAIASCCLAGALVCARRAWWKRLASLAGIAFTTGSTLLPYVPIVREFARWRIRLEPPFGYDSLWVVVKSAFDAGPKHTYLLWLPLLLAGFGRLAARLRGSPIGAKEGEELDRLIYVSSALLLGLLCQILFVKRSAFAPFERYFLTALALSSAGIESLQGTDAFWRILRNGAATVLLCLSTTPVWRGIAARRTDIDIIASGLQEQASPDDLIVLSKWYLVSSFDRYYHGKTPWITAPWTEFRPIYRQDQKALMTSSDPVAPTLGAITKTWTAGRRVWVVGFTPRYVEKTTPAIPNDSDLLRHDYVWDQQLFGFLMKGGNGLSVPVATDEPVNPLEDLQLTVWEAKRRPRPAARVSP